MTREETIEIVKSAFSAWESEFRVPNDDWSEEHEALDMAIKALKKVTGKLNNPDDSLLTADSEACKEQKSKLDLISRAEAIESVRLESAKRGLLGRGDILDILSALPPADRPKGEWIEEDEYGDLFVCSECGSANVYKDNFCPNCGADMRGEDE